MGHDGSFSMHLGSRSLDHEGEEFGLIKSYSLNPTYVGKCRSEVLQESWGQRDRRISPPAFIDSTAQSDYLQCPLQ